MKLQLLAIRFLTIILPFAYMWLIWYLSSQPSDAIVKFGLSIDDSIKESLHFIEFGILYGLWLLFWSSLGGLNTRRIRVSFFISCAYGAFDEIHQIFTPERSATLFDFTKDVIGVLIIWYLFRYFYNKEKSKFGSLLRRTINIMES